jgi:hypothetical protein
MHANVMLSLGTHQQVGSVNLSLVFKLTKTALAVIIQDLRPGSASSALAIWLLNMLDRIPVNALLEMTALYRGPMIQLGPLPSEPYTQVHLEQWAQTLPGVKHELENQFYSEIKSTDL